MHSAPISQYFGTTNVPKLESVFDLIEVSRRGLSKKSVGIMAAKLGLSLADLFVILHISARTWQRYTDEKLLPQDVTEKALQLANLYKQGEDVFGNPEKFKGWMNHPSPIFAGKKPIDLLDTQFGFQAVQDELVRIDWGVLV